MVSPAGPTLFGREVLLEALTAAIAAERPVAVTGEAGIGKTALVRAATTMGSPQRRYEGGGFATLRELPYLALKRAIDRPLDGDATHVAAAVEREVGPDLLFVDDLQWVDERSLDALELLVGRVGLIVAVRDTDAAAESPLARLDRLGFERLRVGPLDHDAAASIVRRLRPGLRPASIDGLIGQSAGNPLLLEELAARGEPSPLTARAIDARLANLSPAARSLVELLAVADRPLPRAALTDAAAEAEAAGLVIETDGSVEVRHALLAASIRDRLVGPERAALHEQLAGLVADPAEAARHLSAAGLVERAAAVARRALGVASGPAERADLLVITAEATSPTDSLDDRLTAARALDDLAAWEAVLRVLPIADGAMAAEPLVERDVLLARAAYALGRHDEARSRLNQAAGRSIDPGGPVAARVAWETAAFRVNVDGSIAAAIAGLEAELGRQSTGSAGWYGLRILRESIGLLAGEPADISLLRAGLDRAFAAGAYATAADLAKVVNIALLVQEGSEPALAFLHEQAHRFDETAMSSVALAFRADVVQVTILTGRLSDAVIAADELAERPAPPRARQAAAIFRAIAQAAMGGLDRAEDDLRSLESTVTGDWFGRGELLAGQAQVALWSGRPGRAIELVDQGLRVPTPIVGGHVQSQITRAWACHELGLEIETASPTIRSLAGAAPEFEGLRLLAADRPGPAATCFAEAAGLWAGFHALRTMTCRWAEGEALRRDGSRAAVERLTEALEAADASGFEALSVRIRRSLRLAGVRLATGGRGPAAAHPRLTRRERELVELVGHGLTNLEMARRMGLGRPTVARILSNAMAKLGADSRAHAVALMAELD